jgi:hypothetical protein
MLLIKDIVGFFKGNVVSLMLPSLGTLENYRYKISLGWKSIELREE